MKIVIFTLSAFVIVACSSSVNLKDTKAKISSLEKELMSSSTKNKSIETMDSLRLELNNTLIQFYQNFSDDKYAAECLDKLHLSYSAMREYELASKYADTLLLNYPKYGNREMVIESQANSFDMFIQPRDTKKVRYYLELLLKEFPKMDKERKEDIAFRLKYLDLTIEQIMKLEVEELN